MKRLFVVLAAALLAAVSFAQDGWLTSYDDAVKIAEKEKRPILAYFTGSDWCGWCHKLDNEVLGTPAFQEWASQYVVLLELDFPKHKEQSDDLKHQNAVLSGKFHVTGFPTVHVLNAKGESMAQQGYQEGGADKWVNDLRTKVDQYLKDHPQEKEDPTKAIEGVPYVKKDLFAKIDFRGKPAPDLKKDLKVDAWLNGKAPRLEGKAVVITLFETACPPCPEFAKQLKALDRQYGNDLAIVALSDESEETVRAWLKQNPVRYSVGIGSKAALIDKFGVSGIPQVLVVSPDGIVRWQGYPYDQKDPLTDEKLATIMAASK